MAELDGAVLVVALGLQEADAEAQLVGDAVELVVDGEDAVESRVVAADEGHVAVEFVAELGVAIAGRGCVDAPCGEGDGEGGEEIEDGRDRETAAERHACNERLVGGLQKGRGFAVEAKNRVKPS